MSQPGKERFLFGSAIALLTAYAAILTFGLFRVQHNAEELATAQREALLAADNNVKQVMAYVEKYHGDDEASDKELQRLKIMLDEHEEKLFLLQDTINQLFAVPE
jgi:hypothetical protein